MSTPINSLIPGPVSAQIQWKPCDRELPDDDLTVLMALDSGEVLPGFRDAGAWRHIDAELCHDLVLWWAEYPTHPGELLNQKTK